MVISANGRLQAMVPNTFPLDLLHGPVVFFLAEKSKITEIICTDKSDAILPWAYVMHHQQNSELSFA
jgi:hypothetical protein